MLKNWDNTKKVNVFILSTIIIIVAAFMLFSPSGIINRILLTKKQKELLQQIDYEKKIQDSLLKTIDVLQNDTLEIERIAREKYGMKRPNEKNISRSSQIKNCLDFLRSRQFLLMFLDCLLNLWATCSCAKSTTATITFTIFDELKPFVEKIFLFIC